MLEDYDIVHFTIHWDGCKIDPLLVHRLKQKAFENKVPNLPSPV